MSLTVTQRPTSTISAETTTWNAVGNPILYKMQRKDFTFNQVNDNAGFVQLQFTGVDISSSFSADDVVYVGSDSSVYTDVGNVTASAFSGGNTLVTLDVAYSSAAPGGYVNNFTTRPLYRVEVEVYDGDDVLLTDAPFIYSPNSAGALVIDVRTALRQSLSPVNNNPMNVPNYNDTDVYIRFYIKYTEVWTGSAESQTNDSASQYLAILGSRQIPSTYAGNMAEYVTFNDGSPSARFLTKFDSPVMWRDYPFLISLIGGDGVTKDAYINADGDTSTPVDIQGKVYSFNITEVLSDDSVDSVEVQAFNDDTVDVAMTEVLTVSLRDACANPVMLLARNSLGGCLQWLFDYSQEYTFDYGNGRKAKRLILSAKGLTINQWEALQDFITLGEVYRENIVEFTNTTNVTSRRIGQQVYVMDEDGLLTGVLALPTSNGTLTKQVKHTFELEIEYPEEFAV